MVSFITFKLSTLRIAFTWAKINMKVITQSEILNYNLIFIIWKLI